MSLTRTQFEEELERLRNSLLEMGGMADRAVADSMQSFHDLDVALAEQVIARDDEMDDKDIQIEADCMRLLALQQPIARDLRLVGTALKIITDLERIGDHAVDIAKAGRKIAKLPASDPLADLPRMALEVRRMLKASLDAFVRHDLELVNVAVEADDLVDSLYRSVRDDLLAAMEKDSTIVVQATYTLFVAHYLERMADHAVNIAERVHFVETGELAKLAKSHHIGAQF